MVKVIPAMRYVIRFDICVFISVITILIVFHVHQLFLFLIENVDLNKRYFAYIYIYALYPVIHYMFVEYVVTYMITSNDIMYTVTSGSYFIFYRPISDLYATES